MTLQAKQLFDRALMNLDASMHIIRAIERENFAQVAKYAEAQQSLAKRIEDEAMRFNKQALEDKAL